MKKRILFFKSTKVFGGGEKHTLELGKIFKENGFDIKILSDNKKFLNRTKQEKLPSGYFYWGQEAGVRKSIIVFCLTFPWYFMKFLLVLIMERRLGAKVVFLQSINEKILASALARMLGMRVYWIEHLAWQPYLIVNPLFGFLKFVSHFATEIIVPSNFLKNQLESVGISSHKIKRIYHGVDLDKFQPPQRKETSNRVIFGYVGRFHKEKGLEYLIETAKEINGNFEIWLIGEGPQKSFLQKNAPKNVIFFPFQEKIEKFYQKIDVFVLPTTRDNLPLTILEAEATGLPIISTKVGGIGEIVETGHNGILVKSRDVSSLAKAMSTLIKNEKLRVKMGRTSRILAEKHSKDKMAESYQKLFE